ncbi:MAG: hypothetical protein OEU26_14635, partial [Candidatus Tectomicrobia bacterium]|nr:hypothetical protein [Candidatus Tectomicrobia bacterium]
VAEEMFVQYQTPRGLTANWLQHNQLLLLLDGLDEAAPEAQEACITAINQFKEGNAAEIVVCSRQEDYAKLRNRLNLTIAVRLQPLALMQMHNYLNRFGERVHGFRDALRFDTELQKLASSPLALSLVPLVYGGRTAAEIPRSTSVEAGRRTLFQNYVQQMFRRRPLPAGTKYVPAQAMQWLSQMGNHMGNETDFYIERLQPTWLTPQNQQRYKWLTKLLGGLTVGLSFGLVVGLNIGLMGWLIGGLALALVVVVAQDGEIELAENLVWQRPTLKDFFQNFMTSFLSVSLAPISLGIVDKLDLGLWGFLIVPVVLPLITAGLLLPLYRLFGLETERLIIGLILVTVLGLTTGLIWGLIWGIRIELITGIIWGLIIGLIWGLIEGLIMEAFQGQETVKRSTPNQSIRQSGNNVIGFLLAGLLGGVVYALVLWWLDGQLWGLANIGYFRLGGGLQGALLSGISMGVLLGFAVSIQFGAQLILCHYILRGLLHREGVLPAFPRTRTLIDFLDAMSDRILLQRLSGGWRFVHRYLKEYITSLSPDEIDALFDE